MLSMHTLHDPACVLLCIVMLVSDSFHPIDSDLFPLQINPVFFSINVSAKHGDVYSLYKSKQLVSSTKHLSFAEFVVIGHKSNRTKKTNNQNPFKRILTTYKICSNGI